MKNKMLLCLSFCLILPLFSSCSLFSKYDLYSSFSNNIEISSTSEPSGIYDNYLKYEEVKTSILNQKKTYQTKNNVSNETISDLTNSYWETFKEELEYLQIALKNKNVYTYFVDKLGSTLVDYWLKVDTNKMFISRSFSAFDVSNINSLMTSIEKSIEDQSSSKVIFNYLNLFIDQLNKLIEANSYVSVLADLYQDNETYLNEATLLDTTYSNAYNAYKKYFQTLLKDAAYKNDVISYFSLSDDDVTSFLQSNVYSDEIMDLFNQETTLEGTYATLSTETEKNNLYLQLVKLRRNIATALGYDSYLDYIYQDVYARSYTLEDANTLMDNIKNNSAIISSYRNFNSKSISYSTKIGEIDLLNNLDYVTNIVPSATYAILDFKTYGNYDLDIRSNKYSGSYQTTLSYEDDSSFVLVTRDGTPSDYGTLFHEFGHYLGDQLASPSLAGNKFDLDIAEVDSQGLEYLMNNYYASFLSSKEASNLVKEQTFNALWTMLSSCVITSFENYVYTTDDELTLSSLQTKFNSYITSYTYPYSFGYSGRNYTYNGVGHIYQAPGYYISYLTSIIPALELWADSSLDNAINSYNTIISYGTSNDFLYVLDQANLTSPFETSTIDIIGTKIKATLA